MDETKITMGHLYCDLKRADLEYSRDLFDQIESNFPNFDTFWWKFLLPLTNYPGDINWRDDIPFEFADLGSCFFAIIKSLNYIVVSKPLIIDNDKFQRYKNSFFHFGLIFEANNHLAREMMHIKGKGIEKYSKEKIEEKTKKFLDNDKYDKKFIELNEFGRAISIPIQYPSDFMKPFVDKKMRKEYGALKDKIMGYRNFWAHNPGVEVIWKNKFALKIEYINDFETRKKVWNWMKLRKMVREEREKFDTAEIIIQQCLDEVFQVFNKLWEYFITEMEAIKNDPKYEKCFNKI